MTLSWRRLRGGRRAAKVSDAGDMELTIPNHFRCPISLDLMKDPVTLATGITYDRHSIETWMEAGNSTCPTTNQVLASFELIPNHTIRKMIQDWCVEKRSFGVERIPTPRIPVTSGQVSEILAKIESDDTSPHECKDSVRKIKAWAKESERNKRCVLESGAGTALAAAFARFSASSFEDSAAVLDELLSALTLTLVSPLDGEASLYLGSASSLRSMVGFLDGGDLSSRRNAALVLKEVVSSDREKAGALAEIEGGLAALVKLVKEPVCPTSTKASLVTMYHMVNDKSTSSSEEKNIRDRFVEMGLVPLLSETLVDADRSVCEKALGVLDGLCGSKDGRETACRHALTMPVVVKKMLRVSDLATEFSVSVLWKLYRNEDREDGGGVLVEALQVGAFQKLLLLLQVGCAERTKDKATELLKALNVHRQRLECVDSMDFKELKRPF